MHENTALREPDGRAAGAILAVAAGLVLLVLSHHPVAHGPSTRLLQTIDALAGVDRVVHFVVVALILAITYGLLVLSQRRGLNRPLVLAAVVLLAVDTGAIVAAGATDGFVIPLVAHHYQQAVAARLEAGLALLTFAAIQIQVWTRLAILAGAVATGLWSLDFLLSRDLPRWYALLGLTVSIAGIFLPFAASVLVPSNLVLLLAAQVLWYAVTGVLLARGAI